MENLKAKTQNPAFLLFNLFFFSLLLMALLKEKGTFLLWLNQRHNDFGDIFFKYITHLGDLWVYLLAGLILLSVSYYRFLLLSMVFLFQIILVQFAKQVIFKYERPLEFLSNSAESFNLVEGVDLLTSYSFPSSHATTAFAIATLVMCVTSNRLLHVFLMLTAILVALSRVYTLQHFLVDILAGAILGTSLSLFVWWFFTFKKPSLLYNKINYHQGLLRT